MRRISKSAIALLACWGALLISLQANAANTITPSSEHSSQISVISGASATSGYDIVTLRKANSAGISYNKFDSFSISDRPVKLVNVARQTEVTTEPAAKLIVIMTDTMMMLSNTIELVGPASDILFISTKPTSGMVACPACQLKNFHRITLAVATPEQPITDSTLVIGKLRSSANGMAYIGTMRAPGSLSVDILADAWWLNSSDISTHQQVSKDSLGGYTLNENGPYSMGTGSVNLLIGRLDWNYENQQILKAYPQNKPITLEGSIRSVAVKVSSSEPMTIHSTIDTRTDLLSSVQYAGQQHISNESIVMQSLGGWTVVNGALTTNGELAVKSNNDLTVYSGAKLTSPKITLISKQAFYNLARIEADTIGLAGASVLNRGEIEAFETLGIWAEKNIVNNFGGIMMGPDITLQSATGMVRNGSRYPYQENTAELTASDEQLAAGTAMLNPADTLHIGTFYRSDVYVAAEGNRVRPDKTFAHIVAKRLKIKAPAVENINPYWERINQDNNEVTLDQGLVNQVTMAGLEGIWMDTGNYVLNSSAIIRVDDVAGVLAIKTGILTNERYRTMNLLVKESEETTIPSEYGNTTTTTNSFTTKSYTYSPPGILVSMGNFELEAGVGFVNNTAYLEVFGTAQFKTGTINDIGLQHNGVMRSAGVTTGEYVRCLSNGQTFSNGDNCVYIKDAIGTGSYANWVVFDGNPVEITIPTPDELDSLFFVHGDVLGNEAAFQTKNYDPLDYYKNLAKQAAEESLYAEVGQEGTTTVSQTVSDLVEYTIDYISSVNFESNILDGDRLLVTWNKTNSTVINSFGLSSVLGQPVVTTGTEEFSLVEELLKLWEQLKTLIEQAIDSLFAEFNWWSEE